MKDNKLIYLANARIPTEKAHGYQIMKMCENFALYNLEELYPEPVEGYNEKKNSKIEVELVVPKRHNLIKEDPFKYYSVKNIFKIKTLPCLSLIDRPIIRHFGRLGLWLQIISFTLVSFFYLSFKKADIIYSRDLNAISLLSFFKKNICYEIHSMPGHFNFYKNTLKRTRKIISISNNLKQLLVEKGIDSSKILVAHDGVDLDNFDIEIEKEEAGKEFGLSKDRKILGYTGSFKTKNQDKGIELILKSISKISQNDDRIFFIAVGGNKKDIEYYYQKAKENDISQKVEFLEKVDLKKLAIFQKACDILLMPFPNIPHYAYYMSPLKMFEYMASKRPIIATDLPSIKEVLNENNSVLVEPDNPEKLAQAIDKTLKNPDFCAKISEQAYQDVQEYTWRKRTGRILEFIKKDY